jgi:hypothetical protein
MPASPRRARGFVGGAFSTGKWFGVNVGQYFGVHIAAPEPGAGWKVPAVLGTLGRGPVAPSGPQRVGFVPGPK